MPAGNGPRHPQQSAEQTRVDDMRCKRAHWNRWGPYLSERAWGTVREDYSADGDAWSYFPFAEARLRVYRWNEDGLLGICDRHQHICFATALWNGHDPILKERLFGLSGTEGNHGEDVKEVYFYLDSTPTHSYMKALYKYPQREFPYQKLLDENSKRTRSDPEYELTDTGIFTDNRYFDVLVEYAKAAPDDVLVRLTITNRGPETAELHVLPTVWFRNTWRWGKDTPKPGLRQAAAGTIELNDSYYGRRWLYCRDVGDLLFTENETNAGALWGTPNVTPYTKDGIGASIVDGQIGAVNPERLGTKAGAHYRISLNAGQQASIELRITDSDLATPFGPDFSQTFDTRIREASEFYDRVTPHGLSEDGRAVMRQAFAGLLWSKQFYHYVVRDWLNGDSAFPAPPAERLLGRNHDWVHLFNSDVISMPDTWEYPWYAAWDLAFHCFPLALIDAEYAKDQLVLMLREWYMHPSGQLPAYEWNFSDVNPPVHAWAAWRIYKIDQKRRGVPDAKFLERVFHKLLLNFTWWVNRKDASGNNIFQGGFLGLDNIGVFNRSEPLPNGEYMEQADCSGWMAMYCLNLMAIALELARENSVYEDVASKFWEHFLYIAHAMNNFGDKQEGMWDAADGFFYDQVHMPDGHHVPLKVRSAVGLIPLFAVETLEPRLIDQLPGFKRRMEWFIANRPDLTGNVASMTVPGKGERRLLSIVDPGQLRVILHRMLDEQEFLSPFGIRSLSRAYKDEPYVLNSDGSAHSIDYEPGESTTGLFGGNSNWRGPVWFPLNYLLIESLQKFHHYLGDEFKVECPTGSGKMMTLWEVAAEISRRLSRIFLKDDNGRRPVHGDNPFFEDEILFYEYFHGESGKGLGASHQTGWTALVAKLLQQSGE